VECRLIVHIKGYLKSTNPLCDHDHFLWSFQVKGTLLFRRMS
jgi:hypothetical protein